MTSVVVLDYGFGNVRSMVRALANVGADVTLTSDVQQARDADGLVVPGVGAFAAVMQGLTAVDGDRIIYERLQAGKPVLGVCVGLQIMFEQGVERDILCQGLGLVRGTVRQLDAPVVPHMGWNTLSCAPKSALFEGLEDQRFYFVHSYAAQADEVLALQHNAQEESTLASDMQHRHWQLLQQYPLNITTCHYGDETFVAAFEQGPLSATQFHPEKSGDAGAALLRNWLRTL